MKITAILKRLIPWRQRKTVIVLKDGTKIIADPKVELRIYCGYPVGSGGSGIISSSAGVGGAGGGTDATWQVGPDGKLIRLGVRTYSTGCSGGAGRGTR